MSGPLLRIEHLEVRYGDLIGVSDVSLEVPEGRVVALLGSNGGGKTTVLNAVAGLTFVVYGAIIVLIARFQPGGILALINRRLEKRRKAPETIVAAGASHAP